MTMSLSEKKLNHQILEQAAEWFALLRSSDATTQDHNNWKQWLEKHPDHGRSWQFVESVGQRFSVISETDPKHAELTLGQIRNNRLSRRNLIKGMLLFAGTSSLGWASWQHTSLPNMVTGWNAQHHTNTGEIRDVLLADGTRVWMNTASAFDTGFDANKREITLLQGEVLIETGKADHRPFLVQTSYGQLRPLGTRFVVSKEDNNIRLSVFEGSVEITPHTASPKVIHNGEQIFFTDRFISEIGKTDPAREAWSRGLLLAEDISLQDLINELSRYRHGYINVAPEVAQLRVFGGFPLKNLDEVFTLLEQVLPIRVNQTLPWWISIDAS